MRDSVMYLLSNIHKQKLIIALLMEAASTSEMSVNCYQITQRNNPVIFILVAMRT
jgi:hypothetical protein